MDTKRTMQRFLPVRILLVVLVLVSLFAWISIPNFVGGGPSKLSGIINTLRQIDGAKQQWAYERGITNTVQLTNVLTEGDLSPYLSRGKDSVNRYGFGFDKNGNIHGAQGVEFAINPLGTSPEAKFTKNFKLSDKKWFSGPKIPKGTILRFGANGEEYILPGQESKPCKSLSELLTE